MGKEKDLFPHSLTFSLPTCPLTCDCHTCRMIRIITILMDLYFVQSSVRYHVIRHGLPVIPQVILPPERLAADITGVGSLVGVRSLVDQQVVGLNGEGNHN